MELNLNETQSPEGSTPRPAIECSPAVLEQIFAHVEQGFYSVPHGGAEVGGVLYGSCDGSRVLIQAARPLSCEHAYGPSFNLSAADYSRLAALLRAPVREPGIAGMPVVGWYHSHTRSEISFSDADLQIHDRFFPRWWQVALVLRPAAMRPTEVGLFVREADGAMRRAAAAAEAALKPPARKERPQPAPSAAVEPRTFVHRNRPAAAAVTPEPAPEVASEPISAVAPKPLASAPEHVAAVTPEPVVAQKPVAAEEPESLAAVALKLLGTKRGRWAAAASLILVAAALAGYLSRAWWLPQRPAPSTAGLQLHATDRNGLLEITWDGSLPALRLARSGTIEITEGPHVHILPVDAEFLRGGSISYARRSETVTVRISVILQDGAELQQQWGFVGDLASQLPTPMPPEPAPTARLVQLPIPKPSPSPSPRAVQPPIPKPSPPAVARTPAATPRPTPQPRSEAVAAKRQPPPSPTTTAAVRAKPQPTPVATPIPAAASRPVAQVVQPAPPPVVPPPSAVAKPPESKDTPLPSPVAPPARVEPQPVAAAPSLSGEWRFGRNSPSGSPFPPESVALSLSEIGGLVQGTLAGRYRTSKPSGLKPDVRFSFQGPVRAGNMRFSWVAGDGRSGSVELIRLPNKSDSLEVVWYSQDRKFIFDDVLVRAAK